LLSHSKISIQQILLWLTVAKKLQLIPFSNPSNEHSDLAHFCLGIIVGLSYLGRTDGTVCVPVGETRQQVVGAVVQYIDGQAARMNENFVPLAIEALQAIWPCKH
jgi:hypothetical protein